MLLTGDPGAGKSTLLGALVERCYALLSDGFTGVEATADGRFSVNGALRRRRADGR